MSRIWQIAQARFIWLQLQISRMWSPLLSHGWWVSTFQILSNSCGQRFSTAKSEAMSHNKTLTQPLWTSKLLPLFSVLLFSSAYSQNGQLHLFHIPSNTKLASHKPLKNLLQLIFKAGLLPYPWFPQDPRYVKVNYCSSSVFVISIVLQIQRGWNSVKLFLLQINKCPFLYALQSLSFTNLTWPE